MWLEYGRTAKEPTAFLLRHSHIVERVSVACRCSERMLDCATWLQSFRARNQASRVNQLMLSVLQKLGIVIAIVVLFSFGFAATIYLSLRGPSVTIPEVVGKNRFAAESELQHVGLNFRIRAFRPSRQIKADEVMFQVPAAGEV